ncbi:Uncharacterised protein [Escherichia coli]|nr:Uncharacterised protein [Escherichia coli]
MFWNKKEVTQEAKPKKQNKSVVLNHRHLNVIFRQYATHRL